MKQNTVTLNKIFVNKLVMLPEKKYITNLCVVTNTFSCPLNSQCPVNMMQLPTVTSLLLGFDFVCNASIYISSTRTSQQLGRIGSCLSACTVHWACPSRSCCVVILDILKYGLQVGPVESIPQPRPITASFALCTGLQILMSEQSSTCSRSLFSSSSSNGG